MKSVKFFTAAAIAMLISAGASAQTSSTMMKEKTVEVGGAPMYPSKNIVENAVNSKDHTTLVAAVKAAGLVETLLKPENKGTLTAVLTYHVVAGKLDAKSIAKLIKDGNGKAELTTVQGGKLWLWMQDNKLWIKDEKGGMASVTIKDVYQSNGVIHVIDAVVLPKS